MSGLIEFLIVRLRPLLAAAIIAPLAAGCAATPPSAAAAPTLPTSATGAANTTIVAIAPPATTPPNLLDFLGITAMGKCIGQGCACIAGILPRLIPGFNSGLGELANSPAVLPINDPANLKSSNPAVAAAAAAMRDEDAAPQKIAALEYLSTRGCSSCVPGAEEAMVAGLDDCTESVRFAAATAIFQAAGKPCKSCRCGNCCTPKIREKLWELGFKMDFETGCPVEPSPRVRRECRLALRACGPGCIRPGSATPQVPREGPDLVTAKPIHPPQGDAVSDVAHEELPGTPAKIRMRADDESLEGELANRR